jgi:hypothetical protein
MILIGNATEPEQQAPKRFDISSSEPKYGSARASRCRRAGSLHVHDRLVAPRVPRAAREPDAPVMSVADLVCDARGPHREYMLT